MKTRASILVAVLWCVALLSVIVVGVLYAASLDLRVVKNQGDLIQAHYLALAGVEKAKALLYHDAADRRAAGVNHGGELYDAPGDFRNVPLGRGEFCVFRRGGPDEGGMIVYGVSDEESRLDLNRISPEILTKLYGIPPEAVAAISGYREKVQPFRTTRELLMVRGVPRELFFGDALTEDWRLWDPEDPDGILDLGWAGLLTVHSGVGNRSATGEDRIHIQDGSQSALAAVPGISSELAKAIVNYRGRNRLETLADLLDVTATDPNEDSQQSGPQTRGPRGQPPRPAAPRQAPPAGGSSGEKLISQDLLAEIADSLTADSEGQQPGLVNINTADAGVLALLPGMDPQLARAVVSFRQSNGFFPNVAWLLKVPGMNAQRFKQAAPHLSARSETFRILSEGKVPSTGARRRIEVVVRVGSSAIQTLSYRENP